MNERPFEELTTTGTFHAKILRKLSREARVRMAHLDLPEVPSQPHLEVW